MMLSTRCGIVKSTRSCGKLRTDIIVMINNEEFSAINYDQLTGDIAEGDEVVLNTTAVELKLGTGGSHFVLHNKRHSSLSLEGSGHIMKLRYTPLQLKVLAVEEQSSPYHGVFHSFESLGELPVLVGTLHSMLAPIAATLKLLNPSLKIAYIMTDAAALPISLSKSVAALKEKDLLEATITIGHSFGGDYEAVNVYNGLIAAKEIANCDLAIVTMGPGIVGTGTPYGFSGVEQGMILDAVSALGGRPIAIPRISFADDRKRHRGISHHSLTVLSKLTNTRCSLVIPELNEPQRKYIFEQINELQLYEKHYIVEESGDVLAQALKFYSLDVETMGRKFDDDKSYFLTAAASAVFAYKLLAKPAIYPPVYC